MHRNSSNIPFALAVMMCASAIVFAQATPPSSTPPASAPSSGSNSSPGGSATPLDPATQPDRSPVGLLSPISATGIPPIYDELYGLTAEQIAIRGKVREYARQINRIKYKHFGKVKVQAIRQQGIDELKQFTDAAAFKPMIDELVREDDDVRLAMLDHFSAQGDEGQAALGWVAIFDKDAAIRNEALKRMIAPAGDPVKFLLNGALRTNNHDTICAAATVAGALNVLQTIPLLIFAQAATTNNAPAEGQGDLAWIAIQTQRAYVQNLVPVVGDNSGGFQPVIGIVSEGVVMRVVDAVVIEYRTPVHSALVAMTTHDWGRPTEYLSYNVQSWWDWFNNEYVPFKNEQAAKAALTNG